MRRFLMMGALAFGVVSLACSSGDITAPGTDTTLNNTNVPASVVITPPSSSDVIVGTTVNLVASVKNATGQDIGGIVITWSSSDATVASISPTGVLTALKIGTTLITGSASGRSASITINVRAVPVNQVVVTVKTSLIVGESATAAATATDASGNTLSGRSVAWLSRDPAVAIVSQSGVVTAISVGSASIEAVVDGVIGSATVVVGHAPSLIGTINVSLSDGILRSVGATTVATATVRDVSGNTLTGRVITWTSSNTDVAAVSQIGVVTATGVGTAVITASSEGKSGAASVVVALPVGQPIATVGLSASTLTLNPGRTSQVSAIVRDINGNLITDRVPVWQSSNPSAVTVSQTGLVTAIALGVAQVTATTDGRTASMTVQVVALPLASLVVAGTSVLQPAQTSQLTTVIRDTDNNIVSGSPLLWTTSAPGIATVSATGLVTAVAPGTAIITARSGIVSGTVTINVPPVATINVTALAVRLQPTQTTQAAFALLDASNTAVTNRAVVWASSAPAVATVSTAGLVTAIAPGTTNITVTSEGVTGTLLITVPPVAVINVTAPAVRLQPTQTTQAAGAILDAINAPVANRPSVWASSAPAVATVSATGVVTAIARGTTNITLTSEGITGTLVITVPPVATINVTATAVTLQPTGTTQAAGALLDGLNAPATNRTSVWASSAPGVATVTPTGFITGVAAGTTNITLTSEGVTGTLVITVPPVATVTVSVGTNFLLVGQTTNATATLRDASNNLATNRAVTWSSGTPAVATISPVGVITVVSVGTTIITGTSEGRTGTLTFTVVPPVGSIAINGGPTSMLVSPTGQQLTGVILDTFNAPYSGAFTWSSSDPSRMTVSQTGLVTAIGTGSQATITISLTAGGVTRTRDITLIGRRAETIAELPRVFLNTAAPPAPDAGGIVRTVAVGATPAISAANFQSALNASQPGDVVELPNGASFTGNFILPFRSAATNSWVTIRPVNLAGMPAQGQRMTPTIAAIVNLPKIISPNNQAALEPARGAHHYRIIGIEFTVPANILSTGIVRFDANQLNLSQVPHNLVLDRSFVHGTTTGSVTRCVALNSASSAVIDSYLSDCHSLSDAQAIGGWSGPGPFKIVNNYLESSGENIMFGGADPGITNLVPADIEIRRNHFFKPVVWQNPDLWSVKNLFELKSATRVLVEGNIFENNWNDAQTGYAINIKSSNQDGACTACGSTDITFRLNLVRNVGAGMVLSGAPDPLPTTNHLARVTVYDNVFHSINTGVFTGDGNAILLNNDPADIVIHHNTMIGATAAAVSFGGPQGDIIRGTIRDNIITGGSNGVKGSSVAAGTNSINAFLPGGTFAANAIILSSNVQAYPTNNIYPASSATAGFVNAPAFDFRLALSSPLRGRGTDGSDLGADIAAVNAAIAGVIVP